VGKTKILLMSPFIEDRQTNMLYEELVSLDTEPHFLYFKDEIHEQNTVLFDDENKILKNKDVRDFRAVYIRSISLNVPYPVQPFTSEIEHQKYKLDYLKESSRIDMISSILSNLKENGAIIINDLSSFYYHNTKAQFYQLLHSQNVNIPPTLASNNNNDIEEFISKHRNVILKSAYGVGATKRVSDAKIDFGKIKTPVLLQKEIVGKTIRVHTVGNRAILSLEVLANDIDSRSDTFGFKIIELPRKVEKEITRINELLGIYYSAWDIILTEDGEGFLLDCNPGPYIMWIGNSFARIVLRYLAEFMKTYSESGSSEEANEAMRVSPGNFTQHFKESEHLSCKFDELTKSYQTKLRIRY